MTGIPLASLLQAGRRTGRRDGRSSVRTAAVLALAGLGLAGFLGLRLFRSDPFDRDRDSGR